MMKDGIQTGDGSNRYINCTTKSHFCTILFDYLKTISCFLLLLLSTSLFVLPSFNLVPLFLVPDSNLRDSNASDMTSGSIGNRILINRSTSTFDTSVGSFRLCSPLSVSFFVPLSFCPFFVYILVFIYIELSVSCVVYFLHCVLCYCLYHASYVAWFFSILNSLYLALYVTWFVCILVFIYIEWSVSCLVYILQCVLCYSLYLGLSVSCVVFILHLCIMLFSVSLFVTLFLYLAFSPSIPRSVLHLFSNLNSTTQCWDLNSRPFK